MTDAMSGRGAESVPQRGQGDGSPLVAGHEGEGRGLDDGRGLGKGRGLDDGRGLDTGREKAPLVASHDTAGREAHEGKLLGDEQCDKLSGQLQHAMTGFVDGPRAAVEEADHVLEEVASRFTDAMAQRRRTLRQSWQGAQHTDGPMAGDGGAGDTEQLRLALRDYRELTERLLRL
ncbi:hypothetical protein OG885_31360 [Streptomyces sp. NBC_00028]|uniref:hypothetical protein n=1 Tax=Streptomyces sp. NBC_00028 TaxID=2975624 RepID=UPI0032532F8E